MKKFWKEIAGLIWTLAGTALVLITLSGNTRVMGLWISALALMLNLMAIYLHGDEEE